MRIAFRAWHRSSRCHEKCVSMLGDLPKSAVVRNSRQRERNRQMRRRIQFLGMLFAIAGASANSPAAFAQLRGEKNASLLNYLGRFHGVGYGDGYHTCPDKLKSAHLPDGQSQLFASPSTVGSLPIAHGNLRPRLGVEDRWVGLHSPSYSSGQTVSQPSRFREYWTPTNGPIYEGAGAHGPMSGGVAWPTEGHIDHGEPTPAKSLLHSEPSYPTGPATPHVPGSPSDSNPRVIQPAVPAPGMYPQPASDKTVPAGIPAAFYGHYPQGGGSKAIGSYPYVASNHPMGHGAPGASGSSRAGARSELSPQTFVPDWQPYQQGVAPGTAGGSSSAVPPSRSNGGSAVDPNSHSILLQSYRVPARY